VYYVVKVAENFVERKAKIFRIAVAIVKIFNAAIGKIFKTWYDNNMLDMTLIIKKLKYNYLLICHQSANSYFQGKRTILSRKKILNLCNFICSLT